MQITPAYVVAGGCASGSTRVSLHLCIGIGLDRPVCVRVCVFFFWGTDDRAGSYCGQDKDRVIWAGNLCTLE